MVGHSIPKVALNLFASEEATFHGSDAFLSRLGLLKLDRYCSLWIVFEHCHLLNLPNLANLCLNLKLKLLFVLVCVKVRGGEHVEHDHDPKPPPIIHPLISTPVQLPLPLLLCGDPHCSLLLGLVILLFGNKLPPLLLKDCLRDSQSALPLSHARAVAKLQSKVERGLLEETNPPVTLEPPRIVSVKLHQRLARHFIRPQHPILAEKLSHLLHIRVEWKALDVDVCVDF
mmetsp:Transcript_26994/g.65181  ORF Transcript_26994/g.65181 Transcript_26994/m.65181 type:complete len:229 (-) Transcript_26994:65-751(-)